MANLEKILKKKTIVSITKERADKINESLVNVKDQYIPMAFNDFIIEVDDTDIPKWIMDDINHNDSNVSTTLAHFYIEYKNSNMFYVTLWILGIKVALVDCEYSLKDKRYMLRIQYLKGYDKISKYIELDVYAGLNMCFAVMYYILNFSPHIEYIKKKEHQKKKEPQKKKKNNDVVKKEYCTKLKSTIKKYIIDKDIDNFLQSNSNKKYSLKNWIVRGHWRTYKNGKKVFIPQKYIPEGRNCLQKIIKNMPIKSI